MNSISSVSAKLAIVFTVGTLLLGGCASTGALHTTMPTTIKLANYKTILVIVSSQVPESAQDAIRLESLTVARLRAMGWFEEVIAGSPEASTGLRLNARIVELKKVGWIKRRLLGASAGRARMVVDAELIDLKTGETIGAFKAEGESSGHSVVAGTTGQAIARVVEKVTEFLGKNL